MFHATDTLITDALKGEMLTNCKFCDAKLTFHDHNNSCRICNMLFHMVRDFMVVRRDRNTEWYLDVFLKMIKENNVWTKEINPVDVTPEDEYGNMSAEEIYNILLNKPDKEIKLR